jgi:tetratricopeptide (TPR) repeat protein
MPTNPDKAAAHLEMARSDAARGTGAEYLINTIQRYGELTGSGEWYLLSGQALAKTGEWDAAVQSFKLATDALPDNAAAWALLGEAQQQNGDDGKLSLDTASKLDPNGELVNGMLGLYYRRQGNLQQALTHLQIAHRANPAAAVWLIESGGTLAAMGNLAEALELYDKAVEINAEDADAFKARAEFSILHNYQVETTGLESARQALALNGSSPVLMDLLGTAYMMLGDFDSAERLFAQALQQDPEQAAILIHLGQLYLYREDRDTAFDYLRRAVSSARDDRLREMAIRLLEENGAR